MSFLFVSNTHEYDANGKPKHPYLGKLYIVLIPTSELSNLNPNFILNLYATNKINISTHYSKDILSEREVTFHGSIPGKFVKLTLPIRVPSFNKDWHAWHEQKYGLTERKFKNRKNKILATDGDKEKQFEIVTALENEIAQFMDQKLLESVRTTLQIQNSQRVWKNIHEFTENIFTVEKAKQARAALNQ